MRQSVLLSCAIAITLVVLVSGCGGGTSANATGKPATIVVSPASLSLQSGEVAQLTATVKDSQGTTLNGITPTWKSDNTAAVQVSKTGLVAGSPNTVLVCGGTWDVNFVTCTPGPTGSANVVASSGTVNSTPVTVAVHPRIANLTLTAPSTACFSQTTTEQITAVAKDAGGNDITSTVGVITYFAVNPSVVTIDANGLATAKQPGATQIIANVSNITSLPITFTTCPPASIVLGTQNSSPLETSFTLALSGTKVLAATVTDTNGKPITDITLTFSSYYPNVVSTAVSGLNDTITATNAGTTSIVASCTPPGCNAGVNQPVYSNVVVANVTGTSSSAVFVTGTGATTIVPIDTTTNALGTPATIPTTTASGTAQPLAINSFVFARTGTRAFLGADHGLLMLDAASNTFTANITNIQGKVISVSPNGNKAILSDPANAAVHVYDAGSNSFEDFPIANAVGADWTPDSLKAFIVNSGAGGNTLYVYSTIASTRSVPLSGAANDTTVLPQGSVAYVAGGAAPLSIYATCDNSAIGTVAASTTPLLLRSTVDAAHVLGLTTGSIIDDAVSVATQPCPPTTVTNAVTEHSFGTTFTPNKLIVNPASTTAYATGSTTGVLAYDIAGGATSTIALPAGVTGTTTADITLDGKQLYVGALGTNDVHVVDTSTALDVKQIAVGLKKSDGTAASPDFVVVRPK